LGKKTTEIVSRNIVANAAGPQNAIEKKLVLVGAWEGGETTPFKKKASCHQPEGTKQKVPVIRGKSEKSWDLRRMSGANAPNPGKRN